MAELHAGTPPLSFGGRPKRRSPSRAGRDLSPRARSRPGWLCIVTSKTGEATSYRGRAGAGRRQQAEREDVGRNSQNSLVLQYVYRLLTEVRPQARDRLIRGPASNAFQDSPQNLPMSSTSQQSTGALFARVYPVVARPLSPVRHVQEPNHIAPATGAYKEVVSTQVLQPPVPRSVGHQDGRM